MILRSGPGLDGEVGDAAAERQLQPDPAKVKRTAREGLGRCGKRKSTDALEQLRGFELDLERAAEPAMIVGELGSAVSRMDVCARVERSQDLLADLAAQPRCLGQRYRLAIGPGAIAAPCRPVCVVGQDERPGGD